MICFDIDSSGKILQGARAHTVYTAQQNKDGTTTEVLVTSSLPAWATNHFDDSDTDASKALYDGEHYTYLNNAWVYTAPTSAEQLAASKNAQKQIIDQAYNDAELAGFTSTADGTSRTYAFDETAQKRWSWLREAVNAGTLPNPMAVKDITGAVVSLTPTQAATLGQDAQTFWLSGYNKHGQLYAKIDAAMTIADVPAVTWDSSTYTSTGGSGGSTTPSNTNVIS